MGIRKTLEDAQNLAADRGGECLSVEYIDSRSKLKWQCGQGHIWYAPYRRIKSGVWCGKCSNNIKLTIDEVSEKVEACGYKLISDVYINYQTPIKVMCDKGHEWSSALGSLIRGCDCPICHKAKMRAKYALSYDFVFDEIRKRNGVLLSETYMNAHAPLEIQCLVCQNIWENDYDHIKRGQWCPECAFPGMSQKNLFQLLKEIFPKFIVEFNYKGFSWLKNPKTNRLLEIDIFVCNNDKSFSLAVEYDGEQHFGPVCFGGITKEAAEKNFIDQQERDTLKNKLIAAKSEEISFFIRFNYKDKLDVDSVKEKLMTNGIIQE